MVEGWGNFSRTEVFNKQNESFASVRPLYMRTEYYFVLHKTSVFIIIVPVVRCNVVHLSRELFSDSESVIINY